MSSQILIKINSIIKNRLIELLGVSLILVSIFLLLSIVSYSPSDPNFIYSPEITEIKNIGGFYGSAISDFILQSIGLISFLFCINLFVWGYKIVIEKKIQNFPATSVWQIKGLDRIFYMLCYIVFGTVVLNIYYSDSFWLIDNGNGGYVGRVIRENIYYFSPLIENQYVIYGFILLTIIFFILSLSIKLNEIIKILFFPFTIIKKIANLFNRGKKKVDVNANILNVHLEQQNHETNTSKEKQPILPFSNKKEAKSNDNIFKLPIINFLEKNSDLKNSKNIDDSELTKNSEFLEKILLDFGVEGKIKRISCGPVVTLYEFEPASGIKVSKIVNLADDIARNTSSISARLATIPGKNTIGIEIPNSKRENVFLNEIISNEQFNKKEIKLPIALGKSISGVPIVSDLYAMPHLLIAGTTGSGKSVCINTIILSLLYKYTPKKCNLILIDPKVLELSAYEGIPHLLCPVITEAKKATAALGWAVKEMESRYKLMTNVGVKNIDGYNSKHKKHMPYIVVIVDEMSDLMLIAGNEIENYIQRLSQMARAAGIHIIMATQRPSVDVITGTIKANFPTRISFQVSSKIDSRTILGEQGAEQLLGRGDMLFMSSANRIVRIHAPYVSESEIEKVNSYLRSQGKPDYIDEITVIKDNENNSKNIDIEKDELYYKAVDIVKTEGKASTSFLQRKLQIGYNRAARIMETMEKEGVVGQANHVGKREIL
jgi:S-DNA-T family DNA segregation ATPase FtsK/SpoIIIE|tara:strand:- start:2189 stop:4336 length:2148 start_codon:yes stop_codon:yes gene_type:complete